MKYCIFIVILFTTAYHSQSFKSKEITNKEALQRKLSGINSCYIKEYNYSFGSRDEEGKTIEYFEYNQDGYEIFNIKYDNGRIESKSESIYDDNNNMINYSEYDAFNNLISKRKNIYDEFSNHTKSLGFNNFGMIEVVQYFSHDPNGRLTGMETQYSKGIYSAGKFKYEGNNLIEEVFYDSLGRVWSKFTYEYLNNKKIKEVRLSDDGSKLLEIQYLYIDRSHVEETINWYFKGNPKPLISKKYYTYDKNSRKIEAYNNKEDGSLNWRIKYKYDNNGNPLEEILYNSFDEPEKITVYEYHY